MTVCCLCSQTGQSLVFVGFVQVLFDILFTGFLSCTGDAGYAQASHVRPMDESWCMWHRWCTLPKESFVSGKDNASARGNPVGGPKFGRVVFERPHVLHLVMLSGSTSFGLSSQSEWAHGALPQRGTSCQGLASTITAGRCRVTSRASMLPLVTLFLHRLFGRRGVAAPSCGHLLFF